MKQRTESSMHRPLQRRTHRDGKLAGNPQYYAGK